MNANLLLLSQIGFAALTVIFLYFLMRTLRYGIDHTNWSASSKQRVFNLILGTILIWFVFLSIWSASGAMGNFENFPFNFAPILIVPLVTILMLVIFSKGLAQILAQIPPERIIVLQNFRVFVELLLWGLFVGNVIPEQMSFEGRNFDILAGLTAPFVSWALQRQKISKTIAIVWNFACLGLLINIVTIAFLSTPSPIRVFMEGPSSEAVATFPICFLPGFLVPLAYTLHFFSLKQLFAAEKVNQPALN